MTAFEVACAKWYEDQGYDPKSVESKEVQREYGIPMWPQKGDFIVQSGAEAFVICEAKERSVGITDDPTNRKAERQLQNLALYVRNKHPHARLEFHILVSRAGCNLDQLGGGYYAIPGTDSHGRATHTLMYRNAPARRNETPLILGKKIHVFLV